MNQQAPAPFSCTYTAEVPDILAFLGGSLILTTYQAGKVILLSPSGENLIQLARNFRKPMGMAVEGSRLALATQYEVVLLESVPGLAAGYPNKPGYYDTLFVPRATYCTGEIDLHDMAFGTGGLWAVNTLFSCLCQIDERYSFRPRWRPPFVSACVPEDRCHLNGMAMADGEPVYVTALARTDTPKGWRAHRLDGGVIVHVPTGEVVLEGLAMPHSPRLVEGRLFFVTSADGALCVADPASGTYEVVTRVPGFARGLASYGEYLFVGHSRIRKKHMFGDLPVAQRDPCAGITVVHRPSGRVAGLIRYHASCEEIYDVHVLPGVLRPGILGLERGLHQRALHTPEGCYWARSVDEGAVASRT
ncbi:MAG: TIGR03032 family protein [Bacteroidetes bacterium]|nr:MAG: TIGR03032 family protein [Bacteroidota bacterium]